MVRGCVQWARPSICANRSTTLHVRKIAAMCAKAGSKTDPFLVQCQTNWQYGTPSGPVQRV